MKVLIVDDEASNLRLVEVVVSRAWPGADISVHQDPLQALEVLSDPLPDLVVVDFSMPGIDGLEFVRRFRQRNGCRDIPLVMITAEADRSIRHTALELGVVDFLNKPIDVVEVRARLANLLALRDAHLKLHDRARHLGAEIRKAVGIIEEREDELVRRLCRAAEYRDPETGWHLHRMARYSRMVAVRVGMTDAEADLLQKAAPMHDIGKVGITDAILLKPGKLDAEEMAQMRKHAEFGHAILEASSSELIRLGAEVALTHHEKWDGSGYPNGLKGEDIPLSGRVVAIADVFDALTSRRPYKEPWTLERARTFLLEECGRHFDPRCVTALIDAWEEVLVVHRTLRDPDDRSADAG